MGKNLKLIVFQESTYGDSTTGSINYTYDDTLLSLINENKTVVSPVIACERAEQVLLKLKNYRMKTFCQSRYQYILQVLLQLSILKYS